MTPTTRMASTANGHRRRVLFVLYGLDRAGPELRVLEFARRFPTRFEVHVLVVGENLLLRRDFEDAGAHVTVIPVARAYTDWRSLRRIRRFVRERGIEVVNSFDLKTLIIALAAAALDRRVRVVHHLISLWDDVHGLSRRALRACLRRVDVLLCNGHEVHRQLVAGQTDLPPAVIIPNGVDASAYAPDPDARSRVRRALGIVDSFVFGTISNVRPVKNLPMLIDAFAELGDPRAMLVCAGGGPSLPDLQARVMELNLEDRVLLPGMIEEVGDYLNAFDCFVLPSLSEGNPNVVIQALATGLPVIASSVGEIPHLLGGGRHGRLVRAGDRAELRDAIRDAMRDAMHDRAGPDGAVRPDEGRRDALARRHDRVTLARTEYALERMIERYVALFDVVASAPPRRFDRATFANLGITPS